MEHKRLLPQPQVPTICPCPDPDQCSLCLHTSLSEDPSQYYPSIYILVFQMESFPEVSPPKSCMHLSSPHTCYMPTHVTLPDLATRTILCEDYKSLFLIMQLSPPLLTSSILHPYMLLNTLFSDTLSQLSSLNVSDQVSHPYKKKNQANLQFCIS